MKLSKLFLFTTKEFPKDAEVISDKLLRKSNMLVKSHSGFYYYTPLLYKTLQKIRNIISQEMDKAGAQEVLLPILMKKELWDESGRWDTYLNADIMFHLSNRKDTEMCLGPTHEEAVTDLVRKFITSYKQLPVILYQQNTKFRDEIRPRFGLMRTCEFIMKDAYSFDHSEKGLDESYNKMRAAYKKIFDRIGLDYIIVQADSGAIGGSGSEEFMITSDSGEDTLLFCTECGYAANLEKADSVLNEVEFINYNSDLVKLHTPNIKTVEELVRFTNIPAYQMIKTVIFKLIFKESEKFAAVLIRGDLEINEIKLQNHFGCLELITASEEEVRTLTGAQVGFAGPFNLNSTVELIGDNSIKEVNYFLCGINETDYHNINVCFERNIKMPQTFDVKLAKQDEICPSCKKNRLIGKMGIEVGHIFKLGTKYSLKMNAFVTNENGESIPMLMGCYGIGTSRIISAAIEQNHDQNGIIWPVSIAPYHILIISIGKEAEIITEANELYNSLINKGYEVLFDDRDVSFGFKMKDADLIGIPLRIVVGKKVLDGIFEISDRKDNQKKELDISALYDYLKDKL
ncbi:MAG: proline--tRNA ligase [Candidatus Delongbacteria bacterium]|nr:proline--tRNA ligase [Candidatus Delongbacteria bacterium]